MCCHYWLVLKDATNIISLSLYVFFFTVHKFSFIIYTTLKSVTFYLLHRYFQNPTPPKERVLHEVATFRINVEKFILSNRDKPVSFNFSSDVFKFLFEGKGSKHGRWQYLHPHHFPRMYFPEGWDKCLNNHGDGLQLQYPAMVRSFISWSPQKYVQGKHGPVKAQRCYQEKITFNCNTVAGSLWNSIFFLLAQIKTFLQYIIEYRCNN